MKGERQVNEAVRRPERVLGGSAGRVKLLPGWDEPLTDDVMKVFQAL